MIHRREIKYAALRFRQTNQEIHVSIHQGLAQLFRICINAYVRLFIIFSEAGSAAPLHKCYEWCHYIGQCLIWQVVWYHGGTGVDGNWFTGNIKLQLYCVVYTRWYIIHSWTWQHLRSPYILIWNILEFIPSYNLYHIWNIGINSAVFIYIYIYKYIYIYIPSHRST